VAVWAFTTDGVFETGVDGKVGDDEVVLEVQGAFGSDAVLLAVETSRARSSWKSGVDVGAVHAGKTVDALRDVGARQLRLEGAERASARSDGSRRAIRTRRARKVVDEASSGAVVTLDAGEARTLSRKRVVSTERARFGGGSSGKREGASWGSELRGSRSAACAVVTG
jgi:hypothetical protein